MYEWTFPSNDLSLAGSPLALRVACSVWGAGRLASESYGSAGADCAISVGFLFLFCFRNCALLLGTSVEGLRRLCWKIDISYPHLAFCQEYILTLTYFVSSCVNILIWPPWRGSR